MTKEAQRKIMMEAFHDELEKNAAVPAILAGIARILPAIGRVGARLLPSLGRGARYAARAANRTPLKKMPKKVLKKPKMLTRWGGEAARNTRLLFRNPKQLMKEQWRGMRTFSTSANSAKIKGGKYYGRFGKPKKVLGYNRAGQAVVQRSALGTATIGAGFSGAGMGGLEFATNKTDAQGRKRSMGNRLMRAGSQGALWTVAPQAAMGYYGLKFVHDIAKSSRKSGTQNQMNIQNVQPGTYPMGM
jgi:hypothetical protein